MTRKFLRSSSYSGPRLWTVKYPLTIVPTSEDTLVKIAVDARERARAPFSDFKVGAAIEDENGHVYTGCNIENATYGLTMCAERVAVFKAVSEGANRLLRIAVVTGAKELTPPCGACRQILWEFCGDAELILANIDGLRETLTIRQLFPRPFDATFL